MYDDDLDYSIEELNITLNESDDSSNFSGYSMYEMSTIQGELI